MTILIRDTEYSQDLHSREKRKDTATHSEKEETQEGGVVKYRILFYCLLPIQLFSLIFLIFFC